MTKAARKPRRIPIRASKKTLLLMSLLKLKAGTALGSLMENEVVNIVVTEKAEVAEAE